MLMQKEPLTKASAAALFVEQHNRFAASVTRFCWNCLFDAGIQYRSENFSQRPDLEQKAAHRP
jgi:hypothetical protein